MSLNFFNLFLKISLNTVLFLDTPGFVERLIIEIQNLEVSDLHEEEFCQQLLSRIIEKTARTQQLLSLFDTRIDISVGADTKAEIIKKVADLKLDDDSDTSEAAYTPQKTATENTTIQEEELLIIETNDFIPGEKLIFENETNLTQWLKTRFMEGWRAVNVYDEVYMSKLIFTLVEDYFLPLVLLWRPGDSFEDGIERLTKKILERNIALGFISLQSKSVVVFDDILPRARQEIIRVLPVFISQVQKSGMYGMPWFCFELEAPLYHQWWSTDYSLVARNKYHGPENRGFYLTEIGRIFFTKKADAEEILTTFTAWIKRKLDTILDNIPHKNLNGQRQTTAELLSLTLHIQNYLGIGLLGSVKQLPGVFFIKSVLTGKIQLLVSPRWKSYDTIQSLFSPFFVLGQKTDSIIPRIGDVLLLDAKNAFLFLNGTKELIDRLKSNMCWGVQTRSLKVYSRFTLIVPELRIEMAAYRLLYYTGGIKYYNKINSVFANLLTAKTLNVLTEEQFKTFFINAALNTFPENNNTDKSTLLDGEKFTEITLDFVQDKTDGFFLLRGKPLKYIQREYDMLIEDTILEIDTLQTTIENAFWYFEEVLTDELKSEVFHRFRAQLLVTAKTEEEIGEEENEFNGKNHPNLRVANKEQERLIKLEKFQTAESILGSTNNLSGDSLGATLNEWPINDHIQNKTTNTEEDIENTDPLNEKILEGESKKNLKTILDEEPENTDSLKESDDDIIIEAWTKRIDGFVLSRALKALLTITAYLILDKIEDLLEENIEQDLEVGLSIIENDTPTANDIEAFVEHSFNYSVVYVANQGENEHRIVVKSRSFPEFFEDMYVERSVVEDEEDEYNPELYRELMDEISISTIENNWFENSIEYFITTEEAFKSQDLRILEDAAAALYGICKILEVTLDRYYEVTDLKEKSYLRELLTTEANAKIREKEIYEKTIKKIREIQKKVNREFWTGRILEVILKECKILKDLSFEENSTEIWEGLALLAEAEPENDFEDAEVERANNSPLTVSQLEEMNRKEVIQEIKNAEEEEIELAGVDEEIEIKKTPAQLVEEEALNEDTISIEYEMEHKKENIEMDYVQIRRESDIIVLEARDAAVKYYTTKRFEYNILESFNDNRPNTVREKAGSIASTHGKKYLKGTKALSEALKASLPQLYVGVEYQKNEGTQNLKIYWGQLLYKQLIGILLIRFNENLRKIKQIHPEDIKKQLLEIQRAFLLESIEETLNKIESGFPLWWRGFAPEHCTIIYDICCGEKKGVGDIRVVVEDIRVGAFVHLQNIFSEGVEKIISSGVILERIEDEEEKENNSKKKPDKDEPYSLLNNINGDLDKNRPYSLTRAVEESTTALRISLEQEFRLQRRDYITAFIKENKAKIPNKYTKDILSGVKILASKKLVEYEHEVSEQKLHTRYFDIEKRILENRENEKRENEKGVEFRSIEEQDIEGLKIEKLLGNTLWSRAPRFRDPIAESSITEELVQDLLLHSDITKEERDFYGGILLDIRTIPFVRQIRGVHAGSYNSGFLKYNPFSENENKRAESLWLTRKDMAALYGLENEELTERTAFTILLIAILEIKTKVKNTLRLEKRTPQLPWSHTYFVFSSMLFNSILKKYEK